MTGDAGDERGLQRGGGEAEGGYGEEEREGDGRTRGRVTGQGKLGRVQGTGAREAAGEAVLTGAGARGGAGVEEPVQETEKEAGKG